MLQNIGIPATRLQSQTVCTPCLNLMIADVSNMSRGGKNPVTMRVLVLLKGWKTILHVETVCLLSKLHEAKHHVNVTVDMNEMIREYYGDAIPIFESKIPFSVKAAETLTGALFQRLPTEFRWNGRQQKKEIQNLTGQWAEIISLSLIKKCRNIRRQWYGRC